MIKKILLSAYACEPETGSEHGIGWGWINFLSKNNFKVEVITRKSNKNKIEIFLKNKKMNNVKFHYFDLSGFFIKFFKGKNNQYSYLYFIIWQIFIFFKFKSYIKNNNFDFVHHVTFGSIRIPSFLGFCHKNFIFGPVAGLEAVPIIFLRNFSLEDKLIELLRLFSNFYIRFSLLMNITFMNSKKIIVSSKDNFNKLSKIYQKKTKIIFATRLQEKIYFKRININSIYKKKEIKILFVGRLISWKGIDILLETFKKISELNNKKNFKLFIRGDGPKKKKIIKFIKDNNLQKKIFLIKKKKNLKNLYSDIGLFFFPSLRETGGMALLEAMSYGIPPAIIKNGGPGEIVKDNCGIVVDYKSHKRHEVVEIFKKEILKLSINPKKANYYSKNSFNRVDKFIWNKELLKIYD